MGKTILTKNQQKIFFYLSKDQTFVKNFYLTGGTALSEFYLHHRFSEDLNFFSITEIDLQWLTSLISHLTKQLNAKTVDRRQLFNRNLVFFTVDKEMIKTEFTYFPMSQINSPKEKGTVPVDSEMDIAVNKFFTIYQKPSARHFIDLYLLLTTKNYKWEELEKLARIKFDTHIDPIQLGSRLIDAEDIQDLPRMIINLPERKWRSYFIEKALSLKGKVAK